MKIFCVILLFCICSGNVYANIDLKINKYDKEIQLAEKYLNNIKALTADFQQYTFFDDTNSKGSIFLLKPGKIRLDYFYPNRVSIILNNKQVTYYDQELDQISYTYVEEPILAFFTNKNISFRNNKNYVINDILKNDDLFVIKFIDLDIQDSEFAIAFDNNLKDLISISVSNSQQDEIKINFYNLKCQSSLSKDHFHIKKKWLN